MGDETVSRREFDLYTRGADQRVTRLETDLDAADQRHHEDMRSVAKQRELDLERVQTALALRDQQREHDLQVAAKQREDDQRAARERSEQRREWTWGRVTAVLTALAALGALAVDTWSRHK